MTNLLEVGEMRVLGTVLLVALILWGPKAFAGTRPPLDESVPANLRTATFALG